MISAEVIKGVSELLEQRGLEQKTGERFPDFVARAWSGGQPNGGAADCAGAHDAQVKHLNCSLPFTPAVWESVPAAIVDRPVRQREVTQWISEKR